MIIASLLKLRFLSVPPRSSIGLYSQPLFSRRQLRDEVISSLTILEFSALYIRRSSVATHTENKALLYTSMLSFAVIGSTEVTQLHSVEDLI